MTAQRKTISLFTKAAAPDLGAAPVEPANAYLSRPKTIPIRIVSRAAIEQLVASFNSTATGAE